MTSPASQLPLTPRLAETLADDFYEPEESAWDAAIQIVQLTTAPHPYERSFQQQVIQVGNWSTYRPGDSLEDVEGMLTYTIARVATETREKLLHPQAFEFLGICYDVAKMLIARDALAEAATIREAK